MLFRTPFPHIIQDRIRLMDNDVFTLKTKLTYKLSTEKQQGHQNVVKLHADMYMYFVFSEFNLLDFL